MRITHLIPIVVVCLVGCGGGGEKKDDLPEVRIPQLRARTEKDAVSHREHGVIAPVRTYEAPIDRRLEDAGFGTIATVTLLMKDTLVRVAEPALVPAGVR